jgi:hypothetical protein
MSKFNFEIQNSVPNDDCKIWTLDFRPYGSSDTHQDIEFNTYKWDTEITEVPELNDYAYVGSFNAIKVEIPLQDVQKIIRKVINRLVPAFNKLAQEDLENSKKSIFYCPSQRLHLIEYVQYKNVNPFHWHVQLTHRDPPQDPGMRDDIYQVILKNEELHLTMSVCIYYKDLVEEGLNKTKRVYFVTVRYTDGRSPAIYDFYRSLTDALSRAEKIHNLFQGKK